MAIPVSFDPKQKIYHVKISMGSPFQVNSSKDLDEYRRELNYKRPKEIRRKIGAIRQQVNERRAFCCVPFFGAFFTNELGKTQLEEICKKADLQMKEIDNDLHVTVNFIKQNFADTENISAFDQLLGAIRSNIMEVVLNRVKENIERSEGKTLTKKSKDALLNMLEKTKGLNITNDPGLNAEIDQMKERINLSQLAELRDEILNIQGDLKSRAQALEIIEPVIVQKEPAKPFKIPTSDRVLDIL